MSKICDLSGRRKNNGYKISHSHVRNKVKQEVNLHYKKIWSTTRKRWLKMRISTRAIKSMHKIKI